MASFEITTPVEDFTGVACGIAFQDGRATVDDRTPEARAALDYFRRRGYAVTPLGAEPEQTDPPEPKAPAKSATKPDWVAWAVHCGADPEAAEALTKDQLVEQYGKGEA